MGYPVRSRVPKKDILCLALGSIIKCYTTLGKNLNYEPPVTLIMEADGWLLVLVDTTA